ncbi:serine hydrolase domain-containing protein [Glaciecola petra]|uniref:Serine hydrolase domain-containing protein n=1 Tax=Glaciecola petra TaxID=3075602 RepID=A0ABU2ZVX2_9ALTE|nr:serine hydrolase domain-containing protein [Aestuariibacter sp. P117]MDT0595729.1 serine hydrolase domain-containing protein [Aestuariibacter sp. P117]
MKRFLILSLVLFAAACNATSLTPETKAAQSTTADVVQGLSKQRLSRIDKVMQNYVDENKLAGTLTLVARNGEIVHKSAIGMQNKADSIPMSEDAIFRIYSMTKPITAVAALTLWEEGKFHMNDPIDKYLPELKNLKVYVSGSGEDMVLEDAKFPIRIIDLFMHTAGFSYGFTGSEVDNLYRNSAIGLGTADPDTVLAELAKLPLNHQPGTKWHYGVNTDVIGFLVEKLSGKKLGEYMQDVIFDPLQMNDTGFSVKPENLSRLASIYTVGENGVTIAMPSEPLGDFKSDPAIHNGGGGLTSTIDDYFVFAQMLLNGGEYNGVRILGRKTVEYLSSNHMPDNLTPYADNSPGEGYGLAVSVTVDESKVKFLGSTGDYGWGGAASTYFRIDPKENMILISMTQFMPYGFYPYMDDYRNLVYQALVD